MALSTGPHEAEPAEAGLVLPPPLLLRYRDKSAALLPVDQSKAAVSSASAVVEILDDPKAVFEKEKEKEKEKQKEREAQEAAERELARGQMQMQQQMMQQTTMQMQMDDVYEPTEQVAVEMQAPLKEMKQSAAVRPSVLAMASAPKQYTTPPPPAGKVFGRYLFNIRLPEDVSVCGHPSATAASVWSEDRSYISLAPGAYLQFNSHLPSEMNAAPTYTLIVDCLLRPSKGVSFYQVRPLLILRLCPANRALTFSCCGFGMVVLLCVRLRWVEPPIFTSALRAKWAFFLRAMLVQ